MASPDINKFLRERIDRVLRWPKESLLSRPAKWGEMNFEDARGELDQIIGLAEVLRALPTDLLPENQAKNLGQVLENAANVIDQVNSFTIQQGNPQAQRNSLVNGLKAQIEPLFQAGSIYVPYLAYQKGDVAANISALSKAVDDARQINAAAVEDAKRRKDEVDAIVVRAREASASAGAAVFTQDFRFAADTFDKNAKAWLGAAAGAAVLTLVAASLMWILTEKGLDAGQITQKITGRLFILGLLITATLWCGQTYRALKHLAIVNRHRALSIQTFQAFSAAAADAATKDAVLIEATRAVFGSVPTGYIEGGGDGDLKILEIARSILPQARDK